MSGAPANSSPMPNFAVGANPNMSPMPASSPYNFLPPYAGLRNEQALPPFEQPGGSLPMDRYMQPQPAPAQPAMAPQMQPQMAPPMQTGGQGWGGPEPAPGTMPELQAAFDPNDPRYLPEQWRGAFNSGWQS